MIKTKNIIALGAFLAVLTMSFIGGCQYHKKTFKCPEIASDTVYVQDSSWYHIIDSLMNLPPNEVIKWKPSDTIFIPADTFFKNVDTMAILRNFYSVFEYKWERVDTGKIELLLKTTVTQNKPIKYDLTYRITQPTQIINNIVDNSTNYGSYISLGFDVPLKNVNYIEIESIYNWRKGYVGIGYTPMLRSVDVKAGVNLFKFKTKR